MDRHYLHVYLIHAWYPCLATCRYYTLYKIDMMSILPQGSAHYNRVYTNKYMYNVCTYSPIEVLIPIRDYQNNGV